MFERNLPMIEIELVLFLVDQFVRNYLEEISVTKLMVNLDIQIDQDLI